jgi:hypothetical protein
MSTAARVILEARADAVRARLGHRIDLLRGKTVALRHPMDAWRREPVAFAILGGAGVALGLTIGSIAMALASRRERRARWMGRVWADVLGHGGSTPPFATGFVTRLVERSITGMLAATLTTVTKSLLERALHDDGVEPIRFAAVPDPFPSRR